MLKSLVRFGHYFFLDTGNKFLEFRKSRVGTQPVQSAWTSRDEWLSPSPALSWPIGLNLLKVKACQRLAQPWIMFTHRCPPFIFDSDRPSLAEEKNHRVPDLYTPSDVHNDVCTR